MTVRVPLIGRVIVGNVLALGLAASPLLAASAMAQAPTAIVEAAPSNPKDAALAAARKGDYIKAVDLAKQAAAAGQPLDADQLDFMTGKAQKQQAELDAATKAKATQEAAKTQAAEIEARRDKGGVQVGQKASLDAAHCASAGPQMSTALTSFGAAASRMGSTKKADTNDRNCNN